MIKILFIKQCEANDGYQLKLSFSNGEHGVFDGQSYLAARTGILLEALRTPAYFKRCFIDAGALCWPNGLELSGDRVFELSKLLLPA